MTLHRTTFLYAVTRLIPDPIYIQRHISGGKSWNYGGCAPVIGGRIFNTRAVPSVEVVTMRSPSGLNSALLTPLSCWRVAVIEIQQISFSSACTTNRFPSSRCASAIQIVLPLESIAETQPQLQPALLRLSAMISQYFTAAFCSMRRAVRLWLVFPVPADVRDMSANHDYPAAVFACHKFAPAPRSQAARSSHVRLP